jgi:hypothetical protein
LVGFCEVTLGESTLGEVWLANVVSFSLTFKFDGNEVRFVRLDHVRFCWVKEGWRRLGLVMLKQFMLGQLSQDLSRSSSFMMSGVRPLLTSITSQKVSLTRVKKCNNIHPYCHINQ